MTCGVADCLSCGIRDAMSGRPRNLLNVLADVVPGYVAGQQFDAHECLLGILHATAATDTVFKDVVDCQLQTVGRCENVVKLINSNGGLHCEVDSIHTEHSVNLRRRTLQQRYTFSAVLSKTASVEA